jgi:hypothetical protein
MFFLFQLLSSLKALAASASSAALVAEIAAPGGPYGVRGRATCVRRHNSCCWRRPAVSGGAGAECRVRGRAAVDGDFAAAAGRAGGQHRVQGRVGRGARFGPVDQADQLLQAADNGAAIGADLFFFCLNIFIDF